MEQMDFVRFLDFPLVNIVVNSHHGSGRIALFLAVICDEAGHLTVQHIHVLHLFPADGHEDLRQFRVECLVVNGQLRIFLCVLDFFFFLLV